ncbi:hypothetical protein LTR86_006174 [Recurvomyces mirabilis]|nr:hypothetical protein LTR86_006174 [Recurvomyces mirabilis]
MAPKRGDQIQRRAAPKTESEMTPAELEEKRARAARLKARVAGSIAEYAASAGHDSEAVRAAKEQCTGVLKRKMPVVDAEADDEKSDKPAGKKTAQAVDDEEEVEKPAEKKERSVRVVDDDQDEVADDAKPAHKPTTKKATTTKPKAKATSTEPKKATTKPKAEPKPRKKAEPKDKVEKAASSTKKKAGPRKTKKSAAKVVDDEDEDGEREAPVPTSAPAPIPQVISVQHGKNAAKYLGMVQKLEDKILNDGAEPEEHVDIFQAVLLRFDEVRVHLAKVERESNRLTEEAREVEERKKAESEKTAEEEKPAETEAAEEVPSVAEEERTAKVVQQPAAANKETEEPAFAPTKSEAVSQESRRSAPTVELTNGTAIAKLEAPQRQDTAPETVPTTSCATAVAVPEEKESPGMQVAAGNLVSPTIPKDLSSVSQEERFPDNNRYHFIREDEQTVPAFISAPVPAAPPLPTFASVFTHAPSLGQQVGYTAPTKSIGDVLSELRQHAIDLGASDADTAQTGAAEAIIGGEDRTGKGSGDTIDLAAPARSLLDATEQPGLGAVVADDVVDGDDDGRLLGLFTDE